VLRGVIERRILVNCRVDPVVLARLLPAPFRPKTVGGFGMAGICLIRLRRVRPTFLPSPLGLSSENAAHRIAVEWDEDGVPREGVFVRRRDTSSRVNVWAGGRLFPGVQHGAAFVVDETAHTFNVALRSDDGETNLSIRARLAEKLPASSVFRSLDEAAAFFRGGALGYSPSAELGRFQGLELRCKTWRMEPLAVEAAHSTWYEDTGRFPRGSLEFDCALLMRDVEHEWHGARDLVVRPAAAEARARPARG
jgi:hypothetical protein